MEHPWIKAGEKPAERANLLGTTRKMRNSMRVRSLVDRPAGSKEQALQGVAEVGVGWQDGPARSGGRHRCSRGWRRWVWVVGWGNGQRGARSRHCRGWRTWESGRWARFMPGWGWDGRACL